MAVAQRLSELMPNGVPVFAEIRNYPSIKQLIQELSYADMHKVIQVMVQGFCNSFNVVRNMNSDQVFEASSYLLEECEGFRVEDYAMMFNMAKRGQLVKIMDRIDISIIAQILDGYWKMRDEAGKRLQEQEVKAVDNQLNSKTVAFNPAIESAFTDWRKSLEQEIKEETEEKQAARRKAVEGYAALNGINIEELEKQFPQRKK